MAIICRPERRMDSVYDCLEAWWKYGYEIEYFWISGVLLVCVGIFGLLGNIANLVVLCQVELRRKVFYKLLILLASFDIVYILSYGITTGYQSLACQPTNDNVGYFTFYFHKIAAVGSAYATISISLERYLGICHPFFKFSPNVYFYILPVLFVTLFVNAPILFEREYHVVNNTIISSQYDWAKSDVYRVYANTVSFIFQTIIPILSLLLVNGAIAYKKCTSSKNLQHLSANAISTQKSTTHILLLIVINSLICQGLRIAYKTLYLFGCEDERNSIGPDCPEKEEEMRRWNFIAPIEKLALMFNSSINFLIYCLVGNTFRQVFFQVFRIRTQRKKSTSTVYIVP